MRGQFLTVDVMAREGLFLKVTSEKIPETCHCGGQRGAHRKKAARAQGLKREHGGRAREARRSQGARAGGRRGEERRLNRDQLTRGWAGPSKHFPPHCG